jgi:hypothetical protein
VAAPNVLVLLTHASSAVVVVQPGIVPELAGNDINP